MATGLFTPFLVPFWGDEERESIKRWLEGTRYTNAQAELEQMIASQLDSGWIVRTTNLGRSALQFVLESMKLPQRSEVIIPSFSCAALAMPIIQANLLPVFADVDKDFNIRFESVQEAYSPYVKVVVLPHLSGCWAGDAEKIMEWARSRNIFVIEDCAQAFGLRHGGKLAGTFSDVAIFSSGSGKLLFGPSGGWVITRHSDIKHSLASRKIPVESQDKISRRIKSFVERYSLSRGKQGKALLKDIIVSKLTNSLCLNRSKRFTINPYRFSVYAMSDIEARLTLLQVQKSEIILQRRREFAARWRMFLNHSGLTTIRILPADNNVHTKMLLSFPGRNGADESIELKWALWSHGVEIEPSYTPLHLRLPFNTFRRTSLPNTEDQWKGAFSVPVRPNLSIEDWGRIEGVFAKFRDKKSI